MGRQPQFDFAPLASNNWQDSPNAMTGTWHTYAVSSESIMRHVEARNGGISRLTKRFDPALLPTSNRAQLAALFHGRVEDLLPTLPASVRFDLIISSPPYNIGKSYERRKDHEHYIDEMANILGQITSRLSERGSICWQVGSVVSGNTFWPLDVDFIPILRDRCGLTVRNRIVWHFGHGLHSARRFSGRYETVIWATKGDAYHFDLDAIRVPQKYPGKKSYKGPRRGQLSSNPKGKNPEDVWDSPGDFWAIPNVKGNHVEKTVHPCQFPVGLAERLIKALSPSDGLVFDGFGGVGSTGVAALLNGRRFLGAETDSTYVDIALKRLRAVVQGDARYRPHDRAIYDHTLSPLSRVPR